MKKGHVRLLTFLSLVVGVLLTIRTLEPPTPSLPDYYSSLYRSTSEEMLPGGAEGPRTDRGLAKRYGDLNVDFYGSIDELNLILVFSKASTHELVYAEWWQRTSVPADEFVERGYNFIKGRWVFHKQVVVQTRKTN